MKVIICGLGYVGVTAAACLIKDGHQVVGIDVNEAKVADVAAGRSPVSEPGVGDLLQQGVTEGRLETSTSVTDHLATADMTLICVGTPSDASGNLELGYILAVTQEIGAAIAAMEERAEPPLIVYRSTMPPGTMENTIIPALTDLAGPPGGKYEIAFNPEFLRESTAIADYYAPAKIVIGEREPGLSQQLRGLYADIDAPIFEMEFTAAEMVKLTDNSFHALKVAFANEIGRIALDLSVDPQNVIDAFLADTRLNISPAYFRPGGPFGGSCLPKDLRAVNALASSRGIQIPVIASALPSNAAHKSFLADRVMQQASPGDTILLLGLSFKSDTDDLRESPLIDLAETLIGKGIDLRIFDPDLKGRTLIGANLRFVEEHLPHLSRLLVEDISDVEAPALVIIGKPMKAVTERLDPSLSVINLSLL
ncbi:MAG: GDP-mannose dehydrogenase [Rhodospirillaceae bacterium]|nr:GDP-mannose dehydrogenase [Rhodospirillaceae bacterium]|tara:strand:+ start:29201 stop:30469 length:1269 start_codon:yes stop_codon:yes gene_type:complete